MEESSEKTQIKENPLTAKVAKVSQRTQRKSYPKVGRWESEVLSKAGADL
jgi:hypothetical protein